tara:strand:+ start:1844 stop:5134 length:3291 start_codon:yes stop_codon:yes gene_type:complete
MALTQISTQGIKDGTITGSDLATNVDLVDNQKIRFGIGNDLEIFHSGTNSFIRDSGTGGLYVRASQFNVQNPGGTENMCRFLADGTTELYFDGSKKLETTSGGVDVTGNLSVANHITLPDQASGVGKLKLGDGVDFQLYHNGSHSVIENRTGNLIFYITSTGELAAKFIPNGAVELYYDNSKKFETTSYGAFVNGRLSLDDSNKITLGDSMDLQIYHDGSNSRIIDSGTGDLILSSSQLKINNADNTQVQARFIGGGPVEIYHNGTKKFETTAGGATVSGVLNVTSHLDMNDSDIIKLGDDDDLQIYHNGTGSFIDNSGTGIFYIRGNGANSLRIRAKSDEESIICNPNAGVELYFDNTKRFETGQYGAICTGTLQTDALDMGDNERILLGDSDDLQIYHNTHGSINNYTGNLYIQNNVGGDVGGDIHIRAKVGENSISCQDDGAVKLYYDAVEKFETQTNGITVIGGVYSDGLICGDSEMVELGNSGDLQIYHNGTNSYIANSTGDLLIQSGGTLRLVNADNSESYIKCINNGAVELYYDNTKRFETSSNGVTTSGVHVIQNENDTAYNPGLPQGGARLTIYNTDNTTSGTFADIAFLCHQTSQGQARIGMELPSVNNSELFFITENNNSLSERMRIQSNGEIAMRSSGTPSDALANLHVQNDSFRVSNDSDGADTTYLKVHAHTNATDNDRWSIGYVSNGLDEWHIRKDGTAHFSGSVNSGRTRNDTNSPSNYFHHGAHSVNAYSGRTDLATGYRSGIFIRAWDAGDDGDRNVFYYTNSGSDTTSVDYDQHQKIGIKANGAVQSKSNLFAGRCESDEGSPNSVYAGADVSIIAYHSSNKHTTLRSRDSDNTEDIIRAVTGGGAIFKVESSGRVEADGSYASPATDYAEYFEWTDGNTNNADRRGITVVMDGEKIRPATDSDNTSNIIGVVSALPAVVGGSAWSEWDLAHQKDAYGSWVTEDKEYLVWNKFGTDFIDGKKVTRPQPNINDHNVSPEFKCLVSEIEAEKAKGNVPQAAIDQNLRITRPSRTYNPDYDPTRTYIPRSQRKEWDAIGLLGKLVVRRGQPIGANWILMKSNVGVDPSDNSIVLDKYFVR